MIFIVGGAIAIFLAMWVVCAIIGGHPGSPDWGGAFLYMLLCTAFIFVMGAGITAIIYGISQL